jgi:hypothetical protein
MKLRVVSAGAPAACLRLGRNGSGSKFQITVLAEHHSFVKYFSASCFNGGGYIRLNIIGQSFSNRHANIFGNK